MIQGACLCGSVRYEVEGPLPPLMHCHCSMCRKHHGSPFASFIAVPAAAVHWLTGDDALIDHRSSAARTRRACRTCGSVAPAAVGDRALVPAANLFDDENALSALNALHALHAFVGSKAPWHVIADGLPKYDGAPPDWPLAQVEHQVNAPQQENDHGSCLCGAVTFTLIGAPDRWFQCHCSRCRRARSAAHASNAFYATSQFAWSTGHELVRNYKLPEAERFTVAFCTRCGGAAPVERDNVPFIVVPASLFDQAPNMHPQAHIHVASKAPWYTPTDDLPQFAELPPA